jgi:hypothetical protein
MAGGPLEMANSLVWLGSKATHQGVNRARVLAQPGQETPVRMAENVTGTSLTAVPYTRVTWLNGASWWWETVCWSAPGSQLMDGPRESKSFYPGARWRKYWKAPWRIFKRANGCQQNHSQSQTTVLLATHKGQCQEVEPTMWHLHSISRSQNLRPGSDESE